MMSIYLFTCGKESACNAGDSWLGNIHWRRDRRRDTPVFWGFPCGSAGKESPTMQETWVQFLGWKDPGKGKGYPLQYSGLENSMDFYSPWGHKESDMTE